MSAAEHSRDDAEPPSRGLNQFSISLSIDDAVDASTVPPLTHINAWIEHAILGVPSTGNAATHFELSVSVVDEDAIQALNFEYRSKNKPTNVLSFPSAMPLLAAGGDDLSFQALGDIVICHPVIVKEAMEQQKPLEHHFAHMLVHSVLHLFGYDHETEEGTAANSDASSEASQVAEAATNENTDTNAELMEALEIQMLAELSIPNPYQRSF